MNRWLNNTHRYGHISQFLHWLMALLIFFMLALGLLMGDIPGSWKLAAINLHKSIGIAILAIAILRLYWRISTIQPSLPVTIKPIQRLASKATHWLLYGLMVIMPLSGWAMSSASGRAVVFFDILTLPALMAKNRSLGIMLKNLHETLSYVMIAVIALHVLAACYHHFIQKDDILKRMLPPYFIR